MSKGNRNRQRRAEIRSDIRRGENGKIINKEINKALAEATDRFFTDETSVILWVLHETFGFGTERLKRFYLNYEKQCKKLKSHYEMSDSDMLFLTKEELKKIGVDTDSWDKERKQ